LWRTIQGAVAKKEPLSITNPNLVPAE